MISYCYFFIANPVYFIFLLFGIAAQYVGSLFPQPGIEPLSPSMEAWSLNHWVTRGIPMIVILKWLNIFLKSQFSVKHQHESAIGVHMSPPSWTLQKTTKFCKAIILQLKKKSLSLNSVTFNPKRYDPRKLKPLNSQPFLSVERGSENKKSENCWPHVFCEGRTFVFANRSPLKRVTRLRVYIMSLEGLFLPHVIYKYICVCRTKFSEKELGSWRQC